MHVVNEGDFHNECVKRGDLEKLVDKKFGMLEEKIDKKFGMLENKFEQKFEMLEKQIALILNLIKPKNL